PTITISIGRWTRKASKSWYGIAPNSWLSRLTLSWFVPYTATTSTPETAEAARAWVILIFPPPINPILISYPTNLSWRQSMAPNHSPFSDSTLRFYVLLSLHYRKDIKDSSSCQRRLEGSSPVRGEMKVSRQVLPGSVRRKSPVRDG